MKSPASGPLATRVSPAAKILLDEFGPHAFQDRVQKKRIMSAISAQLPPGPGRPRDPRWDRAEQLKGEGLKPRAIARRLYPDFDQRNTLERSAYVSAVREALRSRKRQKAAKARREKSSGTKHMGNVPSIAEGL